jgi:hypothetical protein
LAVTVDGVPLPSVVIGLSRPIDPGTHAVEATAPGYITKRESVTLKDAERKAINLTLEVDPNATATPSVTPSATATDNALLAPAPKPVAEPPKAMRIAAYVALGVGAAGLGFGAVMAGNSASKRSEADKAYDDCGGDGACDKTGPLAKKTADYDDQARSALTLSIVGFVVGGVGIASGVTLFVLSSKKEANPQATKIEPWVSLSSAGVRGTF